MAWERQDMGVPPGRELHTGAMHGATPASIPGGQLVTTYGLVGLIQQNQTPYVLVDVLGGNQTIPNSLSLPQASQPGSFNDQTQQQVVTALAQATQGRKDIPLVFYCAGLECWMSYNAALRAINAGYTNVLWYRGGLQAWSQVGGPLVQAGAPQY